MHQDTIYMAPLLGVTSAVYRTAYDKHFTGYDVALAPFIVSCDLPRITLKYLKDILPERNGASFELIPQILSNHAKDFLVMAQAMKDLGYNHVNWNLGCPFPMVTKKKRGSGLLPCPEKIQSILDFIMPKMPNDLSVKVRLGFEDKSNLLYLILIFNDYPLKEIVIHGRTGAQMYKGQVDLSAFESCLNLSRHNIVYNGDIQTVEGFRVLQQRFPMISRWMIGRGGVIDPFLPERIQKGTLRTREEENAVFEAFHKDLLDGYAQILSGPGHILGKMKEVWFYWYQSFENGKHHYDHICRIKQLDSYLKYVQSVFKDHPFKTP